MSDLLDRLQDMVYLKYDDMNAAREAIHHIESQAARIAELEAALRNLDDMIVDLDAGHRELHEVSRFINAALTGGKE
jgi:hypothetical protein